MSSAEALAMKHYSGVFFSSFHLRVVAFKKLLSSKKCFLESVYILFFSLKCKSLTGILILCIYVTFFVGSFQTAAYYDF